jgi:tRNA-splicing ligase RtcB
MKRLNRNTIARACDDNRDFVPKSRRRQEKSRRTDPVAAPEAKAIVPTLFKVGPHAPLPQVIPVEGGAPVRLWSRGMDANAWKQTEHLARLPIIHPAGIALMPDVHLGNGACVGSVLPLRQALVPAAIGVDAGCGMQAVRLSIHAHDLPDNLKRVRLAMEAACVRDTHDDVVLPELWHPLEERYKTILARHPKVWKRKAGHQLGTLGGGNHFNELCLDEEGRVWVMLHSGSRGAGNNLGRHFIEAALLRTEQEFGRVAHKGVGWLPEGCPEFDEYWEAMLWAQDYARVNREVLLHLTLKALKDTLDVRFSVTDEAVSCHHNYVARETHFGESLLITRKGAVRAGLDELAIIPGSMGAKSFIVRGKGDAAAFCSCAHGAGRLMSRGEARMGFSTVDLRRQTEGVECRKDKSVIDEIPGAYKPIEEVMKNQRDLVDIVHTLKQVVCVKGG